MSSQRPLSRPSRAAPSQPRPQSQSQSQSQAQAQAQLQNSPDSPADPLASLSSLDGLVSVIHDEHGGRFVLSSAFARVPARRGEGSGGGTDEEFWKGPWDRKFAQNQKEQAEADVVKGTEGGNGPSGEWMWRVSVGRVEGFDGGTWWEGRWRGEREIRHVLLAKTETRHYSLLLSHLLASWQKGEMHVVLPVSDSTAEMEFVSQIVNTGSCRVDAAQGTKPPRDGNEVDGERIRSLLAENAKLKEEIDKLKADVERLVREKRDLASSNPSLASKGEEPPKPPTKPKPGMSLANPNKRSSVPPAGRFRPFAVLGLRKTTSVPTSALEPNGHAPTGDEKRTAHGGGWTEGGPPNDLHTRVTDFPRDELPAPRRPLSGLRLNVATQGSGHGMTTPPSVPSIRSTSSKDARARRFSMNALSSLGSKISFMTPNGHKRSKSGSPLFEEFGLSPDLEVGTRISSSQDDVRRPPERGNDQKSPKKDREENGGSAGEHHSERPQGEAVGQQQRQASDPDSAKGGAAVIPTKSPGPSLLPSLLSFKRTSSNEGTKDVLCDVEEKEGEREHLERSSDFVPSSRPAPSTPLMWTGASPRVSPVPFAGPSPVSSRRVSPPFFIEPSMVAAPSMPPSDHLPLRTPFPGSPFSRPRHRSLLSIEASTPYEAVFAPTVGIGVGNRRSPSDIDLPEDGYPTPGPPSPSRPRSVLSLTLDAETGRKLQKRPQPPTSSHFAVRANERAAQSRSGDLSPASPASVPGTPVGISSWFRSRKKSLGADKSCAGTDFFEQELSFF